MSADEQAMIPADVLVELPALRADYAERNQGETFQHFYCPMMFADEVTELCMGHIIPAATAGSSRARVVQRADVDNFFGSVAEAEFTTLVESRGVGVRSMIIDASLRRKVRPKIVVDGEEIPHYIYAGQKAANHSRMLLEGENGGESLQMVLARSPQEVEERIGGSWSMEVECDCRVSAVVSLIKSAYLTLFHIHGYRWALSAAGYSVGYKMLGQFFRENRGLPIAAVRVAAAAFFEPYRHMVRPIVDHGGGPTLHGTVVDNRASVCFGSSGRPFALLVYVRVGEELHGVLMPCFKHPDSVEAYMGFLQNDNEALRISSTVYDPEKGQWSVNQEPVETVWPKQGNTFDF